MNKMTYIQITNHIVTKVSKIDATNAEKDKHEGKCHKNGGVYIPDGSVFTGFNPIGGNSLKIRSARYKLQEENRSLRRKVKVKSLRLRPSLKRWHP